MQIKKKRRGLCEKRGDCDYHQLLNGAVAGMKAGETIQNINEIFASSAMLQKESNAAIADAALGNPGNSLNERR